MTERFGPTLGWHLVRRFFGVLTARPLGPREQAEVYTLLATAEADLFWTQTAADQRHALEAARRVRERFPGDRTAVRAALLHDVGKRHSRLGALGRSVGTVLGLMRLPVPGVMRRYLDHGRLGAEDLAAVGAEPLVVEFARRHPGPVPDGFDEEVWAVLLEADRA